jgi:alkylation response protein AidB-like acyl-CoA dehydrogenase
MIVDLNPTPDQAMLIEATRRFLDDTCRPADLATHRDDPAGFAMDYWRQGAELGWTSLLVSADDGGGNVSGEGVRDLGLIAFEFGRTAAPGPLAVSNAVADALARAGTDEQKGELLPALLDGSIIATWATAEPGLPAHRGAASVTARRSSGGYVLTGRKAPVESAGQAGVLLVTAIGDDGELIQLLVPADADGVSIAPMKTLDITRRFAAVTFDDVVIPDAAVLGEEGAAAAVERQLQVALIVQFYEVVGAMDRGIEYTNEWLFNRYSFGRPLASYQALKHRFADMNGWLEAGAAIADTASRHVQDESDRSAELISVGKSFLGTYGLEVLQECVQFHGGIGLTFEHSLHLFLRRVVLDSQLDGTVADHRERLTAILESREAAPQQTEATHV